MSEVTCEDLQTRGSMSSTNAETEKGVAYLKRVDLEFIER